ncbi:hypothetical protein GQ607_015171 [Colletotrichum asianum]|uniref:Uncharacterized protein n=1 Tax=Colletotrichum asianum TaxID=702518 RepID=A0A8H3W0A2_9PEZI|nr:hypothetical protein GQ607_015171 [Colletotrichum asianum]
MRKKNVSTVSLASHGPPMPVQFNHPSICIWAAHPIRLQRPSFSARGCVPPPLSAARPLPPAAARRPSASLSPPREAAFLCCHPPLLDFIHHPLTNPSDVSATRQSREITYPHQNLWREALALLAFDTVGSLQLSPRNSNTTPRPPALCIPLLHAQSTDNLRPTGFSNYRFDCCYRSTISTI